MNSGRLKEILIDHKIDRIVVAINKTNELIITTVTDLQFVTRTRRDFILTVTRYPKPRENRTQIMRNFLLSFKDIHTLYAQDIDKNETYSISNDYSIQDRILQLNTERVY